MPGAAPYKVVVCRFGKSVDRQLRGRLAAIPCQAQCVLVICGVETADIVFKNEQQPQTVPTVASILRNPAAVIGAPRSFMKMKRHPGSWVRRRARSLRRSSPLIGCVLSTEPLARCTVRRAVFHSALGAEASVHARV